MLRKAGWAVLGIMGLSLMLCGGCSAEAQSSDAGARGTGQVSSASARETAGGRQAGGQALSPEEAANLRDTVAELSAEVARLRQEVTRLRTQVAEAGVGGSGATTGTGDTRAGPARGESARGTGGAARAEAPGTGGSGTAGTGAPVVSDVPPAGSGVPAPQGTEVVEAVYTGVVRSVSANQVVIDLGEGAPLVLGVDASTRVLRDGRSIGVRQLEKGEQVRAVVDLVGQDQTLEIAVLPAAAPEG